MVLSLLSLCVILGIHVMFIRYVCMSFILLACILCHIHVYFNMHVLSTQ